MAAQRQTEELILGEGARFLGLTCDVTHQDQVERAVEQAVAELGSLEILVSNAGIIPSKPFAKTTLEDWRRVMTLNLEGTFVVTKAVLPHLGAAGWGRIVLISSSTVWLGVPTMVPYVTSKMGLIGFTRALAAEVGAQGITVNAVTPGLVETETTLASPIAGRYDWVVENQIVQRRQQPEDLVSTLLYLCDERSGFITGQAINVDGGFAKH